VMFSPEVGENIALPALDTTLVKLRLVKKGSMKLLSSERIEKSIQDMIEKSKEQIRPEGKPQDIDLSRYIQDWATRYGFSPQRVKAEIDKWVTEAEQQNDPHQLGLAAYAKKNFGQAGKYFEASAESRLKQIDEAKSKARQLTEEAVTDFRLAGDARYNQYEFDPALALYQQALQLVSQGEEPRLWAEITLDIGRANSQIGLRTQGDRIHHYLSMAVAAYRAALTVYTQAELPQDWAMTQNNLGIALRNQGTRTGGEAGKALIRQAINAYELALQIRTKDALPVQWEQTMSNLAVAKKALEDMK
jgi:tetratricopeptide (TPR) repeat protein